MIQIRSLQLALLISLGVGLTSGRFACAGEQKLKVVELFTSQGCSSCPAADTLLGELAARPDLLALSAHVDYWDYLGWKDPFASAVNTRRQRDYARALSLRYVYTPQIVVQGATQAAGNDSAAVLQAINDAPAPQIPISLDWRPPGRLLVSLGRGNATSADVWIVDFDRTQVTRVAKGENRGRELRNFNVIRSLATAGQWQGQPMDLVAEASEESWTGRTCAVFVQEASSGRILGAARCGQ
jgi:Uncharacterized secreted protein